MKKNILFLFFVLAHIFIFSAENTDLREQFLAMTIAQAHTRYGNGKLGLDPNSDYMGQHPEAEIIIGKEKGTAEYKILLDTFRMIVSDFKTQKFDMYALLDSKTNTFSTDSLTFTQKEISNLTLQQFSVMLLANNKYHIVSRQELDLFANLPHTLQEKVKPYYYFEEKPKSSYRCNSDSDHRVKIACRQKITRSNIIKEIFNNGQTFLLLFGLGSLLYTHYIIKPEWDRITGSPNLSMVARNSELEITNNLIDSLKKNNTPGAENLIKIALENPLKYTNSDYWHFIKSLLPISFFLEGMTYATSRFISKNHGIFIESLLFATLVPFCFLFPSSIIPIAYYNLSNNLPNGLLAFTTSLLALALVWRIKEDTEHFIKFSGWKKQSIEFEKDKTVAECINKYLNDPSIEIRDF